MTDKKFINSWKIADFEIETDTGWADITALHQTVPYKIYEIETETGLKLKCADNHIVFDENMNEIFIKEKPTCIKTINGNEKIIDFKILNIYENMYDFELSENSNHRYYTNGILSHNTLLCKTIARMIDVPFVIADATSLTQSGYVGEDVESVLSKLLQASDYDIKRAEQGIVFIDEIDKIGTKKGNTSITRDVSGEGVQQALLKMLEGTIVNCPPNGGRIHPEQKLVPIDTTNILFICSGAFVGIEEEISRRRNNHSVGFITGRETEDEMDNPLDDVNTHDLRSFGLIPELIGRLPIIAHTTELTREQLYNVLTQPRNALIKQYKTMLQLDDININFKKDALYYIVDKAIDSGVGARGLRGIMEKVMEDYMFRCAEYKNKNINITKKNIEKILN